MKMGNIWKAGKIFGFKILLYVQIGVCIFIFIFFYVCVWPQRGVFVVSIFLRSWPQLCSSSLCLTADLADKICFCFRNCGSNTKQCCFICENLSAVTITQHEGTLSESLTLSSSFIQHRCSPVQYVKWMAGCVPWALVHRHTHTQTNRCRGFVSAYQRLQFSLITVRPVKRKSVIMPFSAGTHCSSWHLSHHTVLHQPQAMTGCIFCLFLSVYCTCMDTFVSICRRRHWSRSIGVHTTLHMLILRMNWAKQMNLFNATEMSSSTFLRSLAISVA